MAIFYATDWYPNDDAHFQAYCKICPSVCNPLYSQYHRTGCDKSLAVCDEGHLHTIKHLGPDWGQIKWIPLHEFCITHTNNMKRVRVL